jgi:acetoin utilization protein AcuB
MTATEQIQAARPNIRLIDLIDELNEGQEVFFKHVRCAQDLMSCPVIKMSLDDNVGMALAKMREHAIRHLPIVDIDEKDGLETFIGIISQRDIARQVSKGVGTSGEAPTDEQALAKSVSTVMTRKPTCAQPDTGMFDLIQMMLDEKIDCIPVVDERQTLVGIVTNTDILSTFSRLNILNRMTVRSAKKPSRLIDLKASKQEMDAQGLIDTHLRSVGDLMSGELITLPPDASIKDAMEAMKANAIRHIPVVEDGTLIGIVSDRDILHALPPLGERKPVAGDTKPTFRSMLFDPEGCEKELSLEIRSCMTGENRLFRMTSRDLTIDAGNLMLKNRISSILVTNDQGALEGIITVTDFLRGVYVLGQMLGFAS